MHPEASARYQAVLSGPSDIGDHLPTFVKLAEYAEHVIELGTRAGVSTIAWLYGLDGHGRLTSVDLDARPDIGDWDHWTFIQGDDLDPDVLAQLDMADVVFIDTNHLYEHTLAELRVYRRLVRPGGRIVCHDTELAYPQDSEVAYPVRQAIEQFTAESGFAWSNDPRCYGLGTIEVP